MQQCGIDVIVATSPENVSYLAAYNCLSQWHNKGTHAYAVVGVDESVTPFLVLPYLEIEAWAEAPSWTSDLRPYGVFYREFLPEDKLTRPDDKAITRIAQTAANDMNAAETLVVALTEKGLANECIALDETGLFPSLWESLVDTLPRAKVLEGSGVLRHARMVKTPAELTRLARSAQINQKAIETTLSAVAPGVKESELVCLFSSELAKQGGVPAFWSISAGLRSAHVLPLVSDHVMDKGDLVKFDVGCIWNLYWADIAGTRAVSTATEEQLRAYEALHAGERAAIRSIRAGTRASDVFEVAVETIRASGLVDYQRTHCGHGIGIAVYDRPPIQARESVSDIALMGRTDVILEEGMVLCIETLYYRTGEWGMTVEDTIVVEKEKAGLLASIERTLEG
jgi:Xaa-Pro dipeptidase